MAADRVVELLRSRRVSIARRWEEEVRRDLPTLRGMSRPALVDHVHEFLGGLVDWVEGRTERAERAFHELIEGHALQRLGYGVGLETLTREYSKLRMILIREALELPSDQHTRESIMRMHEGMDRAINDAMRRYAARRDEVRERFISILGHDLRDPLATVVISARMLANNADPESEQRTVSTRITHACARMQRMIDDVLDFARGHLGGGIPANPTPNDMGEICRAAADEAIGANPDRKISVEIAGDLRGSFDRDRVHQAITNLIGNAIHHTDKNIEIRAYESDGSRVICTDVTSHGPPIPDDIRRRLFDPFAHFDGASPRRGLGLGLYIVQQIALAHGASCEVASDKRATTFRISWPRERERRASAAG